MEPNITPESIENNEIPPQQPISPIDRQQVQQPGQQMKPGSISKKGTQVVKYILIAIFFATTSGLITWFFADQQNTDDKNALTAQIQTKDKTIKVLEKAAIETNVETKTLTNEQIFQEVSTQFSLDRDNLTYFRIHGQDKVSYGNGFGANYAYKHNNTWNKTYSTAIQDITLCEVYSNIPENHRPICLTEHGMNAYMNSSNGSINYPNSLMESYIGE